MFSFRIDLDGKQLLTIEDHAGHEVLVERLVAPFPGAVARREGDQVVFESAEQRRVVRIEERHLRELGEEAGPPLARRGTIELGPSALFRPAPTDRNLEGYRLLLAGAGPQVHEILVEHASGAAPVEPRFVGGGISTHFLAGNRALVCADGVVCIVDLARRTRNEGMTMPPEVVEVDPIGAGLVAAATDDSLLIWNHHAELVRTLHLGSGAILHGALFGGRALALGTADHPLLILGAEAGSRSSEAPARDLELSVLGASDPDDARWQDATLELIENPPGCWRLQIEYRGAVYQPYHLIERVFAPPPPIAGERLGPLAPESWIALPG